MGRNMKIQKVRVLRLTCLYVCLYTCQLVYLKTTCPNFTKFFEHTLLLMAAARLFSDDNAILYVFPVLRMTSCLPIMGYMASSTLHPYRWQSNK